MATDKCSQSRQHEQGFSRFWLIVTQLYAGDPKFVDNLCELVSTSCLCASAYKLNKILHFFAKNFA